MAGAELPMRGRCWLVGSYGVCVGVGRWDRLGWKFARHSGAIRIGPLGLLWGKAQRAVGEGEAHG